MWVLRKIGIMQKDGSMKYHSSYMMSLLFTKANIIELELYNTQTGETVICHNRDNKRGFLSRVLDYSPYGFINNTMKTQQDYTLNFFLCIDDLSLKFLDMVDSVERAYIKVASPLGERLRESRDSRLDGNFKAVDDMLSLFMMRGCIGTLFDCLCYRQPIWNGGEAYMYSRDTEKNVDGEYTYVAVAYKVTFYDVAQVNRFLMKAKVSGRDSLGKRIEEHNRMV